MYDSSGTIGPGINMGRAPKSTGASKAAVTSANTTEMNLSENCIVAYNPDVAGKNNDELYRAEYPDGAAILYMDGSTTR